MPMATTFPPRWIVHDTDHIQINVLCLLDISVYCNMNSSFRELNTQIQINMSYLRPKATLLNIL